MIFGITLKKNKEDQRENQTGSIKDKASTFQTCTWCTCGCCSSKWKT